MDEYINFDDKQLEDRDTIVKEVECADCLANIEIELYIRAGYTSHKVIRCPVCNNPLGRYRCEMGHTITEIEKFSCDYFEPSERWQGEVTEDRPLLCMSCHYWDPRATCMHEEDPHGFKKQAWKEVYRKRKERQKE